MSRLTIYHNPRCGTSRKVLKALEDAGCDVQVILYLKTPSSADELATLAAQTGKGAREILREKEPLVKTLGLDNPETPEAEIIAAIAEHPILLNRPIVVKGDKALVCRPAEVVKEIL